MTKTAKTYGGALYDLAKEEALCEELLGQLQLIAAVFEENPEYRKLLLEPSIPKEERRKLLDDAWQGKIHQYVLNFMKILCDNGTIGQFGDCVEAFRKRYHADEGIMEVRAVCAAELRPELQDKLREKLVRMTGKKIELSACVDTSLVGGIRLELPDRQYDGSVQHHLREIERLLQGSAV